MTLGVDLSDAIPRAAVIDGAGKIVSRGEAAADAAQDPHHVRDAARSALAGAKSRVPAIGVAMPGAFDQVPPAVAAVLREVTSRDTPIVGVSAGNAAAIAEQWTGAARGLTHVITFAIAEHVYAGILVNGEPWLGAHGMAGAISWLSINPVERDDYRRLGGLEAEISTASMVRRFIWRIKSGDESVVADKVKGDFAKITATDIFEASRAGDGVSISVVRDTARYIGMAVGNLATVFDPEVIVLGGVIGHWGDLLLDPIKTECGRRVHPQQSELMRIVLSTLGDDAVAIGAARAAARAGA